MRTHRNNDKLFSGITITPESISFITTYRCTAQCMDCCFQCSPKEKQRLSLEQMIAIIDEVTISFPSIRLVVLTGGECFTLGEDLYRIIEYIHLKKLKSRIVTNGSWATSMTRGEQVIDRFGHLGLDEINFSTGDCHQQWVPIENVLNGIICSIQHNIPTVVNVESNQQFSFCANDLKTHSRLAPHLSSPYLKIIQGIWISSKDTHEGTIDTKCISQKPQSLKRCKQLFKVFTVTPDFKLACCCGLTTRTHSYLTIGNITKGHLLQLWNSQFEDFMKIWLYTKGPEEILYYALSINPDIRVSLPKEPHICEVCQCIFQNKEIIDTLKQSYQRVLPGILLEYIVLSKTKNQLL